MNVCKRIVRSAACCLAAACAAALPLAVGAHEEREIGDGRFNVVVGFIDEPAFVGEKNGLYLRVTWSAAAGAETPAAGGEEEGTPVEGLAGTLEAEVIFGEQTMELELTPAFGEPGVYQSVFFPTEPGDYAFRVFGEIEGNQIDESFTSSPEGFDSVQEIEPFQFPKPD